MKTPVAFIHAAPAAIAPLMQFYGSHAPEFEITNILDDGLLRFFATNDTASVEKKLRAMVTAAREWYGARAALVTCSAAPRVTTDVLQQEAGIPVLKIDQPMAEEAVLAGRRLGVVVSFPPTLEPTSQLLRDAASEAGRDVELAPAVAPEALHALNRGNTDLHDRLILEQIDNLAGAGVDAIVLAQGTMARVLPMISAPVPVFSSPAASLNRLRTLLGGAQ